MSNAYVYYTSITFQCVESGVFVSLKSDSEDYILRRGHASQSVGICPDISKSTPDYTLINGDRDVPRDNVLLIPQNFEDFPKNATTLVTMHMAIVLLLAPCVIFLKLFCKNTSGRGK